MADRFTSQKRSQIMARIGPKNSRPERRVREILLKLGFSSRQYKGHLKSLPGKPDIVFPLQKKAIFVHGCFWHQHLGCLRSNLPTSNRKFWKDKLSKNAARDRTTLGMLRKQGWKAIVIWQCRLINTSPIRKRLKTFLAVNGSE